MDRCSGIKNLKSKLNLEEVVRVLNDSMKLAEANNRRREVGFLSQAVIESDYFRTFEEYGKGKGKDYYPYYGRGIHQLTWEDTYKACSQALFQDNRLVKDNITKHFVQLIVALLLLMTLGATTEYAQKSENFQGTWTWKKGAEEFELTLKQNGNKITGYHFAIGQNGNKVDEADTTGEPSITGTIKDNTAKIKFTSAFPDGSGKGTATLVLRCRHLYWKITSSTGEHYLPLSATLNLEK